MLSTAVSKSTTATCIPTCSPSAASSSSAPNAAASARPVRHGAAAAASAIASRISRGSASSRLHHVSLPAAPVAVLIPNAVAPHPRLITPGVAAAAAIDTTAGAEWEEEGAAEEGWWWGALEPAGAWGTWVWGVVEVVVEVAEVVEVGVSWWASRRSPMSGGRLASIHSLAASTTCAPFVAAHGLHTVSQDALHTP